ncbi:MAG: threonylcarbamoyl-AMP synthase [Armatimonadetes bacterium]|nr:threonylcarbamoyl-AMP synthase [Armatimonadota bacterium]
MKWFRPEGPDDSRLQEVAEALRSGKIVVLPTDTVYGLAADAFNSDAVLKVFRAKGRPPEKPLALLVADGDQARQAVAHWPPEAESLAKAFWPGPLTLVLPKSESVPLVVTAGLPKVGVREPGEAVTVALIRRVGSPLAATSANRSGRPPPLRAEDAVAQLGTSPAFVVDCGPCPVGVVSTVLDLTVSPPCILRPGAVSAAEIEPHAGPVNVQQPT